MAEIETYKISEPYLHTECALGEGPYYEEATGELRFVDIVKKEIHSVNLAEGPNSHKVTKLEHSVGITADIDGHEGEYIVAAKLGFAIFNKTTGQLRYIKKVYDDPTTAERFNDGNVDSKGRFWAGTMYDFHSGVPQPEGCVFRLDPDLTLHRMIENVCIPNGMGWSPDDQTFYFTDSPSKSIVAYDFDPESGNISNKRTFFTLDDGDAVPDGCTVDSEGYLWVAIHEGSRVIRVSPEGKQVAEVKMDAWKITCPIFGGPNNDELFITSAGVGSDDPKPEGCKDNGAVFRFKTSTTGLPSNKFVLSAKP
ncbi:uncharacterized protein H6S33_011848 [Morchella sextelata]|uniref:uncharacterized protein n=1 Tax=Morchella sextelata TaxID=1174677 RepID=UPI001D05068C|nr:uncharacterized protein H6S33_011848 [Morchella sextelata]KAH0610321.1 hypothetical protein H6S33_011848 [Morchella sextelata]